MTWSFTKVAVWLIEREIAVCKSRKNAHPQVSHIQMSCLIKVHGMLRALRWPRWDSIHAWHLEQVCREKFSGSLLECLGHPDVGRCSTTEWSLERHFSATQPYPETVECKARTRSKRRVWAPCHQGAPSDSDQLRPVSVTLNGAAIKLDSVELLPRG